jgi:hypothetical protein
MSDILFPERGAEDAGKAKAGISSSGTEIIATRDNFNSKEHTNGFVVFSAALCVPLRPLR